jgi:hypothetical protein
MKQTIALVVTFVLIQGLAHAQQFTVRPLQSQTYSEWSNGSEEGSPIAPAASRFSSSAFMPSYCPFYTYYDENSSGNNSYTQSLPSSMFAVRVTPAEVCTVWVVSYDFEINNAGAGERDTLHIFIKDGAAPYTQLFHCYFLTRAGSNAGEYEIKPPPTNTPPVTGSTTINPKRDFYIGAYIKGRASHQVVWKFKTPALYGPPAYRSVVFTSATAYSPVATVLGYNADMVLYTRCCHRQIIPVELSSLSAVARNGVVELQWRTETETNNLGFEIYRSNTEAGPWTLRGFASGHGSTTEPQTYNWNETFSEDERANNPAVWYRLRQLDADGGYHDYYTPQCMFANKGDKGFALYPVYPNPVVPNADPAAVIGYRAGEDSHVRIEVFDNLGRLVTTLVNDFRQAGSYQVVWTMPSGSSALTAGRYMVRLTTDHVALTRPLMLQR